MPRPGPGCSRKARPPSLGQARPCSPGAGGDQGRPAAHHECTGAHPAPAARRAATAFLRPSGRQRLPAARCPAQPTEHTEGGSGASPGRSAGTLRREPDDPTAFSIVRPAGQNPGQPAGDHHSAPAGTRPPGRDSSAPGRCQVRHRGRARHPKKARVGGQQGLARRPRRRGRGRSGRHLAARLAQRHADYRGDPARRLAARQRAAPALRRLHRPGIQRRDASRLHRDRPRGDPGRPVLPPAP
jgi:hypothetical protein